MLVVARVSQQVGGAVVELGGRVRAEERFLLASESLSVGAQGCEFGGALFCVACTQASLEPTQGDGPPPVDNRLTLTGEICTEVPRDDLIPVKVMVVVLSSGRYPAAAGATLSQAASSQAF